MSWLRWWGSSESSEVIETRKKVETGDAGAQYTLGLWLFEGQHNLQKDVTQAVSFIMKSAEQGNPEAQYWLGNRYSSGLEGTPIGKDLFKAISWWEKAAQAGNSFAQTALGVLFCYGTTPNVDTGLKYLQSAAAQGNAAACFHLGSICWSGLDGSVAKNLEQAVQLLEVGLKFDELNGAYRLGRIYEELNNTSKAVEMYSKAAEKGFEPAKERLSRLLRW